MPNEAGASRKGKKKKPSATKAPNISETKKTLPPLEHVPKTDSETDDGAPANRKVTFVLPKDAAELPPPSSSTLTSSALKSPSVPVSDPPSPAKDQESASADVQLRDVLPTGEAGQSDDHPADDESGEHDKEDAKSERESVLAQKMRLFEEATTRLTRTASLDSSRDVDRFKEDVRSKEIRIAPAFLEAETPLRVVLHYRGRTAEGKYPELQLKVPVGGLHKHEIMRILDPQVNADKITMETTAWLPIVRVASKTRVVFLKLASCVTAILMHWPKIQEREGYETLTVYPKINVHVPVTGMSKLDFCKLIDPLQNSDDIVVEGWNKVFTQADDFGLCSLDLIKREERTVLVSRWKPSR